jgi:CheY-like chemotaxis protein
MSSVLIVEDDADSREALSLYLGRKGYQVHSAPDATEALAMVMGQPPDVVVLDMFMPGVDGPSLLRTLRFRLKLHALPVVVLTAMPQSKLSESVRLMGVSTILAKGTASFEDVHRAIEEALPRVAPLLSQTSSAPSADFT